MFTIINILGYFLFCFCISLKKKTHFVNTLPIANCGIILILLVLATRNKTQYIMYFALGISLISIFLIVKYFDLSFFKEQLFSTSTYSFIFTLFILFLSLPLRFASFWDELGVWAIETKAFFYLNGFEQIGRLVAPSYAKYYPGQMLFESWVCELGGENFNEGLMYVAYYYLYMSFCLPLFANVKTKKLLSNISIGLLVPVVMFIIPSSVEIYGYSFLSVELLISAGFALLLHLLTSEEFEGKIKYILILATASLIMLFKESGIIFVLIAFLLSVPINSKKFNKKLYFDYKAFLAMIPGYIPVWYWLHYCEEYYRSNYLTVDESLNVARDNMHEFIKYLKIIFLTMLKEPLHVQNTKRIDMSIAIFFVFITVLMCIYAKLRIVSASEVIKFCVFYAIIIILSGFGMAYVHAFIFREGQYEEAGRMIASISRYLEPLFTGILIYILTIPYVRKHINKYAIIIGATLIILTARFDLPIRTVFFTYDMVNNTKTSREEVRAYFEDLFNEIDPTFPGRILLVTKGKQTFNERMIKYEACPATLDYICLQSFDEHPEESKETVLENVYNGYYTQIFFREFTDEELAPLFGPNVYADTLIYTDEMEP